LGAGRPHRSGVRLRPTAGDDPRDRPWGERVWGLEKALAYYRERSSIEITLPRLECYRAFNGLLQVLYTHHSAHLIRQGGFRDARFLWTAWENGFRSTVKLGYAFGFSTEGAVDV
jgi:hypothetical protein